MDDGVMGGETWATSRYSADSWLVWLECCSQQVPGKESVDSSIAWRGNGGSGLELHVFWAREIPPAAELRSDE